MGFSVWSKLERSSQNLTIQEYDLIRVFNEIDTERWKFLKVENSCLPLPLPTKVRSLAELKENNVIIGYSQKVSFKL